MSDLVGRVLGRFRVVEKLGAGGVGTVYLAEDSNIPGRTVALKFLRPEIARASEHRELLRREVAALAKLNHPFITTLFDAHEDEGHFFFSMEYVEGETLADHLRAGPLPVYRTVSLAIQLAEALAHAHGRGVLHRDIKPGNVKVSREGFAKLMDFGLASGLPEQASSTATTVAESEDLRPAIPGQIVGTYSYMSPEQAQGWTLSRASDVFSFGVMLYEMVTGIRPFQGAGPVEVLRAVREQTAPPIDSSAVGIPHELAALIDTCLVKNPSERLGDMKGVLESLRTLQATLVMPVARATSRPLPLPQPATPAQVDPFRVGFVGRNAERDRIELLLNRAAVGNGSTILVEGEAGIGKSRFVDWCLDRATGSGGFHGRGICLLRGGAPPFAPFAEAAGALIAQAGLRTTSDLDEFLERTGCPEPLRPAITGFLGFVQESEISPDQMLAGATQLFLSLAGSKSAPSLLAIEDVQWADEATVDLFCYLAHRVAGTPLVLTATFRPERDESGSTPMESPHVRLRDRLASREDVHLVSLSRLSESDVVELANAAVPESGRDPRLLKVIYDASEGNPLFALEYLRQLRADGQLTEDPSGIHLSDEFTPAGVPRRVQELLERRLDHLQDREREVLEAAALQGGFIDPAPIAVALEMSRLQLLRVVRTLQSEHHLLVPADEGFRFDHPSIREVLLQSLGGGVRREFHLLLAEAMQQCYGDDEVHAAAIASHLSEGGQEFEAVPYLTRAGRVAARAQALADAHRHLQSAWNYHGRHATHGAIVPWELVRDLVGIKHKIGDDAGAQAVLRRLLEGGHATPDAATRAWALISMAVSATVLGEYSTARNSLTEAEALIEDRDDPLWMPLFLERANLALREARYEEALESLESASARGADSTAEGAATQYRIGHVRFLMGDSPGAESHFRTAGKWAAASGDRRREAMVQNALGNVARVGSNSVEARQLCERAVSLAEQVGDRKALGHATNNLALALAELGEHDRSIELHRRSLALKRELGDQQGESNSLYNIANLCHRDGHLPEGLSCSEEATGIKRRIGETATLPVALLGHGSLLTECGRPADARRAVEEALHVAEATRAHGWVVRAWIADGDLHLASGRLDESLSAFRRAADRAPDLQLAIPRINAVQGVVRARAALGQRDELAEAMNELETLATEIENPQVQVVLHEARALVAWSEERYNDAERLLADVLDAARAEYRFGLERGTLRALVRLASEAVGAGSSSWQNELDELEHRVADEFETDDERRAFLAASIATPVWNAG